MAEARRASGLAKEIKTLGLGSITYLLPTVLTRGLTFFLTPLYTRFLTPADYGIVGLATTLVAPLSLLFGWSAHSATYRLYHSQVDEAARRRLGGAILWFMLAVPASLALLVEVLGSLGAISMFKSVPYSPYLRLVVWTAVFGTYNGMAINHLMVREQHRRAASMNGASVILTATLTVLFVVILRKGAFGQLLAIFLTTAAMGLWSLKIAWGFGPPLFDRKLLREIVLFSIPLVPHEMSKWILSASDRIILERFVSTAELGRYSLGYTFGSAVGMFLGAMGSAFFPIVSRKLSEKDPTNQVPYLGSIVILTSAGASVAAAALLPSFIDLVTPATYHSAGEIVPWVALGFFFQGAASVWSQGTFYARRTGLIALVTLVGAVTNIALNLVLVPRYGALAAAVTTAIGYAVMAGLHGVLARKTHPVQWEYGRTARIALAGALAYGLALGARGFAPLYELLLRSAILGVTFPALLFLFGAVRRDEIRRFKALLAERRKPRPAA